MQRGLDVSALVQRHNDSLLQVEPVVGAHCHSQQPQATDCKDTAQQSQGLPAACTHGHSRVSSSSRCKIQNNPSSKLEEKKGDGCGTLKEAGNRNHQKRCLK